VPYADVEGLRLYYERAGTRGAELLFVHGWCCDHTAFGPQLEHFAKTHAVTALDLRGCGRSDRSADGYTIPDFADDLAQFCTEVGIDKPIIAGHSLGGMIGVDFAARYPSVPAALVLVDPGPIDPLPSTVEFFRGFAAELEGPDGEDVRRRYVQDMGAHDEEWRGGLRTSCAPFLCRSRPQSSRASMRGTASGRLPTARFRRS
jgi:pimeloyl-ACP methyl ester carboxylesterase